MDIEARIQQLKAQIAEKEAYQKKLQESYSNPYKNHSYTSMWDYVVEGNRAGFDKEDAEAAAYQKLLMEQAQADKIRAEQAYNTAYENKLNRENTEKIAAQNRTSSNGTDETAKLMREVEYAQAEYDMAKDNLDVEDPKSVADYKKATSKYNYWIKQLPKEFEGYTPYDLDVNKVGTSPRITAKKEEEAHNKYTTNIQTLLDNELGVKEWTNANRKKVKELIGKLDPEKDKVLIAEYNTKLADKDKDGTKEDKAERYRRAYNAFLKKYRSLRGNEQIEYGEKNKGYFDAAVKRGDIK